MWLQEQDNESLDCHVQHSNGLPVMVDRLRGKLMSILPASHSEEYKQNMLKNDKFIQFINAHMHTV